MADLNNIPAEKLLLKALSLCHTGDLLAIKHLISSRSGTCSDEDMRNLLWGYGQFRRFIDPSLNDDLTDLLDGITPSNRN